MAKKPKTQACPEPGCEGKLFANIAAHRLHKHPKNSSHLQIDGAPEPAAPPAPADPGPAAVSWSDDDLIAAQMLHRKQQPFTW